MGDRPSETQRTKPDRIAKLSAVSNTDGSMSENRCHGCLAELEVQVNHLINEPRREYRIFWSGLDKQRYGSPACALKHGGDPDQVRARRVELSKGRG